jgi:hypothetical protein
MENSQREEHWMTALRIELGGKNGQQRWKLLSEGIFGIALTSLSMWRGW